LGTGVVGIGEDEGEGGLHDAVEKIGIGRVPGQVLFFAHPKRGQHSALVAQCRGPSVRTLTPWFTAAPRTFLLGDKDVLEDEFAGV